MTAPRTAIADLRAMVDRLVDCAADHGGAWEEPGTPAHLMVEAAKLMRGLADAMERAKARLGMEFVLEDRDPQ